MFKNFFEKYKLQLWALFILLLDIAGICGIYVSGYPMGILVFFIVGLVMVPFNWIIITALKDEKKKKK